MQDRHADETTTGTTAKIKRREERQDSYHPSAKGRAAPLYADLK
jgi:hypothetical protein